MKKLSFIQRNNQRHWVGNGFPVRSVFSYNDRPTAFSPFLLLDYAGPAQFEPTTERRGVGDGGLGHIDGERARGLVGEAVLRAPLLGGQLKRGGVGLREVRELAAERRQRVPRAGEVGGGVRRGAAKANRGRPTVLGAWGPTNLKPRSASESVQRAL